MSTHYGSEQKEMCDYFVGLGQSVKALQDELKLQIMHTHHVKIKVRQDEEMTGIASRDLPHESASTEQLKKILRLKGI